MPDGQLEMHWANLHITKSYTQTSKNGADEGELVARGVERKVGHVLVYCGIVVCFFYMHQRMLHQTLPASPQLCLLGDRSLLLPDLSQKQFGLALAGFDGALRIVLRHWKSPTKLVFNEWYKLMTDIASSEYLIVKTVVIVYVTVFCQCLQCLSVCNVCKQPTLFPNLPSGTNKVTLPVVWLLRGKRRSNSSLKISLLKCLTNTDICPVSVASINSLAAIVIHRFQFGK